MLTTEEFRSRFPALRDTVHLASCSQGAVSDLLSAALLEFQFTLRDEGAPWPRWMREVESARTMFARHVHAGPEEVAIVPTASAAAYQVASTQDWGSRPRLVTTDQEFPSVSHVWLAQRARGAQVEVVPTRAGQVELEDYAGGMGDSTGLVSVPLVSYRNGMRLPAREVAELAHAAGARVFVDAYQAAGVMPIDVAELGCDYLTTGSLKYLLGLPGIAFLYVRAGVEDEVSPTNTGWFGRVDPFSFDPSRLDFPAEARRFEGGTPSIPSAFAAVAGLKTLELVDLADVDRHVRKVTAYLQDALTDSGERLFSPMNAAVRGPQVALLDPAPERLAAFLARRRIVTSPRGAALRIAFHYYNGIEDVEALLAALAEYRRGRPGR